MPDLDPPSIFSSPALLPIVPSSNPIKSITNGAENLLNLKILNPNSLWEVSKKKGEVREQGELENPSNGSGSDGISAMRICSGAEMGGNKSLIEHVKDWVQRRIDSGASEHRCYLPFLVHAPRMVIAL